VGRKVVVRYALSGPARVAVEVRRCGGRLLTTVNGGARAAGLHKVVWNGKIRGRRPSPGCYSLRLRATSADGRTAADDVRLRLARRAVRRR
jgi:hypothetical protein